MPKDLLSVTDAIAQIHISHLNLSPYESELLTNYDCVFTPTIPSGFSSVHSSKKKLFSVGRLPRQRWWPIHWRSTTLDMSCQNKLSSTGIFVLIINIKKELMSIRHQSSVLEIKVRLSPTVGEVTNHIYPIFTSHAYCMLNYAFACMWSIVVPLLDCGIDVPYHYYQYYHSFQPHYCLWGWRGNMTK